MRMMTTWRWWRLLLCLVLALAGYSSGERHAVAAAVSEASSQLDAARLDRQLDGIMAAGLDEGMAMSVWVGGATGDPWYVRDAEVWRPAASAIKTAYLVELFDAYAGALDEPVAATAEIVSDPTHPALAHFTAVDQADVREHLTAATPRAIGRMMIRGTSVSNAVYNAAANVTTALLGGPEALTRRIHGRAPAFSGLAVRRYMLAARDVTGDNEATAASLAAVLQRIAARDVPGVDRPTVDAMWDILHVPSDDGPDGAHYYKSGSLNSDPLTRVRSGFWHGRDRVMLYVVMVEQPDPGRRTSRETGEHLAEISVAAAEAVLNAARAMR